MHYLVKVLKSLKSVDFDICISMYNKHRDSDEAFTLLRIDARNFLRNYNGDLQELAKDCKEKIRGCWDGKRWLPNAAKQIRSNKYEGYAIEVLLEEYAKLIELKYMLTTIKDNDLAEIIAKLDAGKSVDLEYGFSGKIKTVVSYEHDDTGEYYFAFHEPLFFGGYQTKEDHYVRFHLILT